MFLARPVDLGAILAKALLVAALTSSAIGLLQYFGTSAALSPWINVSAPGYAFGNLRQRNQLASLLNIGLAVLVWSAWSQRARVGNHTRSDATSRFTSGKWHAGVLRHGLLLLAVVLLASANAATASRTGLLQLLALFVLAFWWQRNGAARVWPILGGALLAYAAASVLLPLLAGFDPLANGIMARFGEGGQSCESRLILWRNVLHLIAQKPWWGWGWGELDYAHFIALYPGDRFCDILDNAHNLPLHLAVELGLPVAVAFCGCVAWLVWRARPWREQRADRRMAWAVLALLALHSLLEYPLWYGPFQLTALLCLVVLWRTPPPSQGVPGGVAPTTGSWPPARFMPVRRALMGLAVVVLAGAAYAAWDYWRVSQIYRSPALRAPAYRDDTLAKIGDSCLFRNQVRFAALTLTRVTPDNALAINRNAHSLLHFSPEARVVEKLIDSALVLGRTEEAANFMRRYRIAYPKDYARWRDTHDSVAGLPAIDS